MARVCYGDYCGGGGEVKTPRTDAAWAECKHYDSRFPLKNECEKLEEELSSALDRIQKLEAFISDLQEIEFNDTDASYWRRESIRIPSGETLYVGGSKPK